MCGQRLFQNVCISCRFGIIGVPCISNFIAKIRVLSREELEFSSNVHESEVEYWRDRLVILLYRNARSSYLSKTKISCLCSIEQVRCTHYIMQNKHSGPGITLSRVQIRRIFAKFALICLIRLISVNLKKPVNAQDLWLMKGKFNWEHHVHRTEDRESGFKSIKRLGLLAILVKLGKWKRIYLGKTQLSTGCSFLLTISVSTYNFFRRCNYSSGG